MTRRERYVPDRAEVRAWLEESCAEQGIPVGLEDPDRLRTIADLLATSSAARASARKPGPGAGRTRRGRDSPSGSPHDPSPR